RPARGPRTGPRDAPGAEIRPRARQGRAGIAAPRDRGLRLPRTLHAWPVARADSAWKPSCRALVVRAAVAAAHSPPDARPASARDRAVVETGFPALPFRMAARG